jgi:hypothetical protein
MAVNIWKRFEKLIEPAAEEVVKVTSVNSDGTVTGQTFSGGNIRVRCSIDVEVGDQVFVAAKSVTAKAPSLDYYEIEV